jgi:hypothetical protein
MSNTNNYGGPYQGFSTVQTTIGHRETEDVNIRTILRKTWDGRYINSQTTTPVGVVKRITTPYRAVNHLGDYLGRVNYSCGGPNQINPTRPGRKTLIGSIPQKCDGTGIQPASCNVRFVADSSDYTRFRKQQAMGKTYNKLKDGGYNNSAYVDIMGIRRY